MKILVRCQDEYEAQKLSSLVFLKDDAPTFVSKVLNIVENEIIVSLRDGSAHSVMVYDSVQADMFADFMQSVFDGSHKITGAKASADTVEITKN